jgi:hypothetical protein
MTYKTVEWVLAVFYGRSAHRATYGRLTGTKYTKDYIQLSRSPDFMDAVSKVFPGSGKPDDSVPLTYKWPGGLSTGAFVYKSADRPHLKWETRFGAPAPWKMSLTPSDATPFTIPGDPSKLNAAAAEMEFEKVAKRGAGQPYLIAVKLKGETDTLHLRVYLGSPAPKFEWANLTLTPKEIQDVTTRTSQQSALAWTTGKSLFFDPNRNHDAWSISASARRSGSRSAKDFHVTKATSAVLEVESDSAAEALQYDTDQVEAYREQIAKKDFSVADSTATVKTRGSAQRVFAYNVKRNYSNRCAVTGISTRDFLVASHIVPWSEDETIRLDPSNGICLSLLLDRAFEKGFILIEDDLSIKVVWQKVGSDKALSELLRPFDGRTLSAPRRAVPRPELLARRRKSFK